MITQYLYNYKITETEYSICILNWKGYLYPNPNQFKFVDVLIM